VKGAQTSDRVSTLLKEARKQASALLSGLLAKCRVTKKLSLARSTVFME